MENVTTFEIQITITVNRYPTQEGTWMYVWTASNWDSPDEWFETAEEAIADARRRF